MQSYGIDDDDRDGRGGSLNGSSENEADEPIDDLDDADAEGDPEPDEGEGDIENEDDNDDNDDDDDEQDPDGSQDQYLDSPTRRHERAALASQTSFSNERSASSQDSSVFGRPGPSGPTSHPNALVFPASPSPQRTSSTPGGFIDLPLTRPEALRAPVYDIVPTIAAPHSTSINAITATPDLRWVFSGGSDGYIRKFNWVETVNGKVMLTVAQRHPFVDSVTKAGVLASYWENEEPNSKQPVSGDDGPSLSAVYALAVQHQGLWLLSGLDSGGINLQSVRHDEGKRITCLRKHTSTVSVLDLAHDERSLLSGSWDKTVVDWDLNIGSVKRTFDGSGGQISALEMRPMSSLPVPETSTDIIQTNGTFSSDYGSKPRPNGILTNGIDHNSQIDNAAQENGVADAPGSPADSLFGENENDNDSLFGEKDEGDAGAPSGGNFADDDDDEFSRAIANGIQQQENEDAAGDISMADADANGIVHLINGVVGGQVEQLNSELVDDSRTQSFELSEKPLTNGLPHSEEFSNSAMNDVPCSASADLAPRANSTFLEASFDGSLRIWDKRKPSPVAKITPKNVPPWCMNACWSPDGNFIYVGRRNGTVEEFSLHKALRGAERTFKFPNGSGPVSAVRAMPNGRHLICASHDILRLYDLQQQQTFKHSTVPFLIVPGHRTGVVSQLYIDATCRYMISTAGNRGWEGNSTEVLLGYEIGVGI